jgi:hypothetical protein
MKRLGFILLMFCAFTIKAQQNMIINGSFENNTATTTIYNLSNIQYNTTIASSSSFGQGSASSNGGEIDLYKSSAEPDSIAANWKAQDGDWFITPAALGDYYITMNWDTLQGWLKQDAFSLTLIDTLSTGSWYTLSFYIAHENPLAYPFYLPGRLSVGISHYADSFGVIIDTTAFTDTTWTQHSFHFQATDSFAHITCRPVRELIGVNFPLVDNFSLKFDSTGTYIPPPVSYNCNSNNACIDPTDGSGIYSTLAACQTACITSAINEQQGEKQLLKIVDILGKESSSNATGLLFYIYSDGTVEKRIIVE